MGKWIKKIRENLKSKKGFTMVEMVVTIILTSMLFTMGCTMLLSWGKAYDKLKTIEHAEQLADTLMDKISGELSGAQDRNIADTAETSGRAASQNHVIISEDNTSVELYDRTGSHIKISAAVRDTVGRELNIHYYAVKSSTSSTADTLYDAVDWKFSENMYMNYYIESLTFETVKSESGELLPLIDVTLKIHNDKYDYTCTVTKTVECYNSPVIAGPDSGGKIPDNPPPADDSEENNKKGSGSIEIEEGTLTYHIGERTLEDIQEEADAMLPPNDKGLISVPYGIYYDSNADKYYFVTEDTVTDKYDSSSMGNIRNYKGNWNKVLELNSRLITESDIINGDHFAKDLLQAGSIYEYKGQYYICITPAGGWPGVNPVDNSNWIEMDLSLFTVK